MNITNIEISNITEPGWNANQMSDEMARKLKESIRRYDLVIPLE